QVKEHAEAFSEGHYAAGAGEYVEVFGRLYQNLHNVAAAQKAADDAIRLAGATNANVTDIVNMMTVAHENFGSVSTDVANSVAAAMRKYSLAPDSMQQMTLGIAKFAPSLKALHGNMADALAITGQAEQLMGGGRGVQMIGRLFEVLPEVANKAHLNLGAGIFGVLDQIKARTRGLSTSAQINVLAGMKIDRTMAPEIMRLVDNLDKMRDASAAIKAAGGTILTEEEVKRAATF